MKATLSVIALLLIASCARRPEYPPFDVAKAQRLMIQRYFKDRKCPDGEEYTLVIENTVDPPLDPTTVDLLAKNGWKLKRFGAADREPSFPRICLWEEWDGTPLPSEVLLFSIGVVRDPANGQRYTSPSWTGRC